MATRFVSDAIHQFQFRKGEFLEKIIENLQCCKCGAIPTPNQKNRYNCFDNSHTLCESCKANCKCGSPVGKRPNPIFRKMLEELPGPWFCPHYKTGCREKFVRAEWIDGHAQING